LDSLLVDVLAALINIGVNGFAGDIMFLVSPGPEINELAAFAAKGAEGVFARPGGGLFAGWAGNDGGGFVFSHWFIWHLLPVQDSVDAMLTPLL